MKKSYTFFKQIDTKYVFAEYISVRQEHTFARLQQSAKDENRPMLALFKDSPDDKWPITGIKSLITQMTSYEPTDRINISGVHMMVDGIRQSLHESNR